MKTLRLRDTQHLAARNSTAEVTAVISTLRAGRDPGGWLGTPVTRQTGLGAEKALHTQDPEGRCPGHSPGGHAHRLMSQDRPQERKHGHAWALRSPARCTRRSTTACLGDAPACVAEAACHLRAPRPMPRSAHTNHRSPRKERACPSPRPPGGHIHPGDPTTPHGGAPGHSGRAPLPALRRDCHPRWEDRDVPVSGPCENSASRLPGASQGGSSPPPPLPDTRAACRPPAGERPARQLLVPFTRAGQLCCRCHRIRGTLGRVRLGTKAAPAECGRLPAAGCLGGRISSGQPRQPVLQEPGAPPSRTTPLLPPLRVEAKARPLQGISAAAGEGTRGCQQTERDGKRGRPAEAG